jgi:hypothetical protein
MRSSTIPLDHTTSRGEAVTLLRLSRIINFIKSLRKNRIDLPAPRLTSDSKQTTCSDRTENGLLLLSQFLADGIVRGITPDGTVYEHPTALHLTRKFLTEFQQ